MSVKDWIAKAEPGERLVFWRSTLGDMKDYSRRDRPGMTIRAEWNGAQKAEKERLIRIEEITENRITRWVAVRTRRSLPRAIMEMGR